MDELTTLRIVVTGPVPPPVGGMALQTRQLVSCLMAEGLSVVMVPCNAPLRWPLLDRIPVLRALLRLRAYRRHLHQVLREADLVHVMANSGWSWYLFAVPAIHIAHRYRCAIVLNYRGGLAESFLAKAYRRVGYSMRLVDQLVVPTDFLRKVFAEFKWPAVLLPNILDERSFKPVARSDSALQICVTRNLEALYDNASAIRAFALVKQTLADASLVLCGEGAERDSLEQLVEQLQLNDSVQFAGRLQRPELLSTLAHTHVLLNPSRADNSPNSLIEAMACGIPIVSTNVGGIPVLCRDGQDAILVDAGDHVAMAEAIVRVHRDERLRQQLIQNGQENARRFYWSSVRDRVREIYQNAIAQRKQRHA